MAPAARARVLAHAAQTVRYLERPVMLEGRPVSLTTYIVWEGRQPRTFSFIRRGRRTDQARIVRVDETSRQVTVLVPARGAVVQFVAPIEAVVTYSQSLRADPPPQEVVARANEILGSPGALLGSAPQPETATAPPVERVAAMREVMGRVKRVDRGSRRITLEGPAEKTPIRVPEGVELPSVGQTVSLAMATDAPDQAPVAVAITPLLPTVAGVLTRVQPVRVELHVRTRTPEGEAGEVPVPVTRDTRVYVEGKPAGFRELREGVYIQAFITPNGEVRILGDRNGRND
jgi:hypothetical protein